MDEEKKLKEKTFTEGVEDASQQIEDVFNPLKIK